MKLSLGFVLRRSSPLLIEMIGIADEAELHARWADFIPHQHDMCTREFFESSVARFPRRTAEWKMRASLYGMPSKDHGPLLATTLAELQDKFRLLAAWEKRPAPA